MNETLMQHGDDWQGEDLTGWLASEKFDGCRAYWDGETMWSRGGIAVKIPESWRAHLPTIALDCELYDGAGGLRRCTSAIRYGKFTASMRLIAFDAPGAAGCWSDRMQTARDVIGDSPWLSAVDAVIVENNEQALSLFRAVKARGGEGLMVRRPGIAYRPGRTRDMLKIKYM